MVTGSKREAPFIRLNQGGVHHSIEIAQMRNTLARNPMSTMYCQAACIVAVQNPDRDGLPDQCPDVGRVDMYPKLTVVELKKDATLDSMPLSGIRRGRKVYHMLVNHSPNDATETARYLTDRGGDVLKH